MISNRFKVFFGLVIAVNIALWLYARPLQAKWQNVPPAPTELGASAMGIGDDQFSYRITAIFLQNLGNVGGRNVALAKYNYTELKAWFIAAYNLDHNSAYIPFLAAYYFGATPDEAQKRQVIRFLRYVGQEEGRERWRWLTHSAFMALHKIKDLELALQLAKDLKTHPDADVPMWARHMEFMIRNKRGEKETAYDLARSILLSSGDNLHRAEVLYLIDYICDDILSEDERAGEPICQTRK